MRSPIPPGLKQQRAARTDAGWEEQFQAFEFRYRRLFETAPYGILLLDAESGQITDANSFLLDLLDYPYEEVCGRQLWEMGRYEDIAANRAAFRKLQETKSSQSDNLALRKKDGEVISIEIVCQVYREGEQEAVQCTIRKAAGGRGHAAASLALRASRAQKAWMLAYSQRLRTPLTEVAWMLGLMELEQELVPQSRSRFDEAALRHVRRNLQILVHSFNDLAAMMGESPLWLADRLSPGENGTASPPRAHAYNFTTAKPATLMVAD